MAVLVYVLRGVGGPVRLNQEPPPLRRPRPFGETPPSTVAFPVRVPLEDVRALAERVIPPVLMRKNGVPAALGVEMDMVVERDGDFAVAGAPKGLVFRAPVRFEVLARWSGPVGMAATQRIKGRFRVYGRTEVLVEKDWRIRAETEIGLRWDERPSLSIGGLRIGMAGIVEKTVQRQLKVFSERLDERLNERIRLRDRVSRHWESLQSPRRLSTTPGVWFRLRPEAVSLSPVHGEDELLRLDLGLLCRPLLSTDAPPTTTAVLPLPDLSPPRPEGGAGVVLHLPVTVGYDELARLGLERLGRASLPLPDGSMIRIAGLRIRGNGERVEARVELRATRGDGSLMAEGAVWLQGRPAWNAAERVLELGDVDFAPETASGLVREAAWLLRSAFRRRVGEGMRLSLGTRIDEARRHMERAVADRVLGEGSRLRGRIDGVDVAGVWVGSEALRVVIEGRGTLEVDLDLQRLVEREGLHGTR